MKKVLNQWRLRLKSEQFWLLMMLLLVMLALFGVARGEILALLIGGAIFPFFLDSYYGGRELEREASGP